jgi:xanthine dehydrogenase large subunit
MEGDTTAIRFVMGGRIRRLVDVPPSCTVLAWLREREGRTGTKEGCAEGDCGACTVVVGELVDGRLVARPVNACITFLPALDGRALETIEDLAAADGTLHPVQEALVRQHASQCGFCTPGIAMAIHAYARSGAPATPVAARRALAGNLCRCTGYRPVVDAAVEVASARPAPDPRELRTAALLGELALERDAAPAVGAGWLAPTTLDALAQAYADAPDAVLVGGATDLGRLVTKEHRTFGTLIHTGRVPELRRITCTDTHWEIGGAATIADVSSALASDLPDLAALCDRFGSEQIRAVATVGGNLATASAVGDLAPPLLALDATLVLRRGERRRELPAPRSLLGARRTALEPGELIATIRVPRAPRDAELRVYKVAKRVDQDITTVSVAAFLRIEGGVVRAARLAFGGVADRPCRIETAEAAMLGRPWTRETARLAAAAAEAAVTPRDDVRGSAVYRRRLIRGVLEKLWLETSGQAPSATRVDVWKAESGSAAQPVAGEAHDSAVDHVTGAARYVDDLPEPAGTLAAAVGLATRAHARLRRVDLDAVRAHPGVVAVVGAGDVPGVNDVGTPHPGDPVFARDDVVFDGQVVFAVAATTTEAARRAVGAAVVEYEDLPPLLGIDDARAADSHVLPSRTLAHGDAAAAIASAPHRLSGRLVTGAQDHWYLEGQIALVAPSDGGTYHVVSSTQHPGQVQEMVARVLGLPESAVTVEVRRLGGGIRRQGDAGRPGGGDRGGARATHRTSGEAPPRPRRRHADDRQAPRRRDRLGGRLRRRRPDRRARRHARAALRPLARSLRRGRRPGHAARRRRVPPARRTHRLGAPADAHRVEHGVPRVRRAAGDARYRGGDRRHRAPPGSRSARRAPREPLLRRAAIERRTA